MHLQAYLSPREVYIYDCGVNPCLLHINKSRPHLSTYITTQEGQEVAALMCEGLWIQTRSFFLNKRNEQPPFFTKGGNTTSKENWKAAKSVGAVGYKQETALFQNACKLRV